MAKLRAATRDQHESLEHDFKIGEQLGSISGLRALLARWYGFYLPFEDMLAACPGVQSFAAGRSKTPWLRADLEALGRTSLETIPLCASVPPRLSLPEAVGAMYVTEGSSLGGSIIARNIERHLGLRHAEGYSFFVGYGSRTGSMWREFSQFAEPIIAEHPEPAMVSARETFSQIHRWLNG